MSSVYTHQLKKVNFNIFLNANKFTIFRKLKSVETNIFMSVCKTSDINKNVSVKRP